MSQITSARTVPARADTRRRVSMLITLGVIGWSTVEFVNLLSRHTTGPELYGLLVAALSVVAGVLSLVLLGSGRGHLWITVAVLILWSVVALGGLAGMVAHIIGPVQGHGPIDLRARPVAAPLIFTVFGLVGGASLRFEQRRLTRSVGR